ncbi:MAG TPA: carbon-nitrogen hydrolase family protein [candidate division Zixibacteria bacterium]|nr:carbon-nitrogen hydrolase family protein [candidate division Zixibacteria bacterium]
MFINVVLCQLRVGLEISLAEKIHIFKNKPDFVCLPEYFLIPPESKDYSEYASRFDYNLKLLARWSDELDTTFMGGTIIEKSNSLMYNTCFIFRKGQKIASYRKCFPTEKEQARGITPGRRNMVFEVEGVRVGILICADVLHEEVFQKMRRMNADIIFVPTVSPLLENDSLQDKAQRDSDIFVRGAEISRAYVVKTCGLGTIFGKPQNGRSLVAAPWGIIWQVSPEAEQNPRIQTQLLDIEELREFRRAVMIREVVKQIKLD